MIVFRPKPAFVFSHPAHIVAFGFGAGLAPFAPGTFGTLLGWAIAWALPTESAGILLMIAAVLFLLGIWACEITGRHLGVGDHPAMVWDEVVAFLLILAIVPRAYFWQLAAFVAFRFFDIVKPPPIRFLERRYGGGLGVMVDDIVAALYALLVLALLKRFFF
jgi:phosphatidylglycerophosphatase A